VTAAEIAAALGGAHHSGAWWHCRCSVHCSRGATLALRDVSPATWQPFTGWARVLLADLIRSANEARVRRCVKQIERDILRPFGGDRFPPGGPMRIIGRAQGDLDAAP
jgi:hypothetical protein